MAARCAFLLASGARTPTGRETGPRCRMLAVRIRPSAQGTRRPGRGQPNAANRTWSAGRRRAACPPRLLGATGQAQLACTEKVAGSNPAGGSTHRSRACLVLTAACRRGRAAVPVRSWEQAPGGRSSAGQSATLPRSRPRVRAPPSAPSPCRPTGRASAFRPRGSGFESQRGYGPIVYRQDPGLSSRRSEFEPRWGYCGVAKLERHRPHKPEITRVRVPPPQPFPCSSRAERPAVNRFIGVRVPAREQAALGN
jgi:hypothetical protein